MYKYVQNSVVKISVMFAKYFEYYTIILGGRFLSTRWSMFLIVWYLSKNYTENMTAGKGVDNFEELQPNCKFATCIVANYTP